MDTGDDLVRLPGHVNNDHYVSQYVAEHTPERVRQDMVEAHCSQQGPNHLIMHSQMVSDGVQDIRQQQNLNPAEEIVRQAEASRARILNPPGKTINPHSNVIHSALLDEVYIVVGSPVDEQTK